jgi:Tol biopolymer transport system component/DNA-binding winged helix-turn-helix (wHTH) protein
MDLKPLIYQFDNLQVNRRAFKVLKDGSPLPLEPKAFEVLVFLIDHRGRLVEKNELLDAVWKESFVTTNALTRVIAHLRKTLGDDAKVAKYIETVPTRGYRFIAEVKIKDDSAVVENDYSGNESSTSSDREDVRDPDRKTFSALERVTGRILTPRQLIDVKAPALVSIWILSALVIGLLLKSQIRSELDERSGLTKTTQITTTPGLDLFPAFSPDGGVLAYSSLRNGNFEIFVRQLAPGGREIQITSDGAQNVQPAWSPDGKMVAYHSRNRHGIWVVPALGGVAKQLADFGAEPSWSSDGEWIAFQSDAPDDLGQTAFGAMPPSTIWIVSSRGGTPQQITQVGAPPGGHGVPIWSPDSKRIVFVTHDIGLSELWSTSANGGELKRLRRGPGNIFDPAYTSDGRYLFFSTASGNFRLWMLRLSSETGLPVGDPVEIANTGNSLARHLAVSPDGKRLAYSSLTMVNNIGSVMISPKSSEATSTPTLLTQDTNYRKNTNFFSPDGKTIAYNVWRMGAEGEVWLMDADGGNPRQLTAEPSALLGWLPEGNQALLISKVSPSPRLLNVDVISGKQMKVADYNTELRMGRLSPDGRQVAFNSRTSGTINVWTVFLDGGEPKQLTFDRELMGFACWSPDSQFLAFEMKRGDDCHIAIIPRDGGPHTQLTFDRGQSWPGDFSPDGDKIAFAGLRNGRWNIWWVSRSTRIQKQVTNYTKPNIYVRYPAWSPLDNQIVYEYAETTGNIWMMELK